MSQADDQTKAAIKEAVDEWLEKKFATLGKWSAASIAAMALAALVYFILWAQGWRH